ncbi:MAG TPA: carboxyl transferase domain-containing protein [Polyangiales bacterium]|nr:carboxyl transferase domain-containing protein [Polyangiales bacterium]
MTNPEFKRIAILNRGEAAMRFIIAAREYGREHGDPLHTISLHTDPDRRAMFVREADQAYSLGSATYLTSDGQRRSSYLDHARVERALVATGAEAVWPGWGFAAERPDFADLCDRLGIVFIGPTGDMMRQLGDKIRSKQLAERANVPVAPWSGGAVHTLDDARRQAARLGYPLMIKATAGGGGRGIRRVGAASELAEAFQAARSEAEKSFGDGTVFLERMVTGARHVEVQIIADDHGATWALGVRDCTLQRRNQKILEETPSPALNETQSQELERAALRLAQAIGYRNAGTVEFLYHPPTQQLSFMEVNARLQVEHPVSEMTTGVDLVKLQIHVARGGRLEGEPPAQRGHAIEVRLNAEDAEDGFAPSPGLVEELRLAGGPGLRIDTGIARGDEIPADFDSMIAKIIAQGRTREEAMARLRRALLASEVVIRGGASNKGFLLGLIDHPAVRSNEVDVGWVDRLVAERKHLPRAGAEIALLQAAIDSYDAELDVERAQFYTAAARGRPHVEDSSGQSMQLTHGGNTYELDVFRLGPSEYRIDVDGQRIELTVDRFEGAERRLQIKGRHFRIQSVDQGLNILVEVDGVPHRISRDRGGLVRAPSPAVVVNVLVREGQHVDVGDGLVVLEAMKMEMVVGAKFSGRVREVMVMNNVQLPVGAPIVLIEPSAGEADSARAERLDFSELSGRRDAAWSSSCQNLTELRCLVMGYDADGLELSRKMADGDLVGRDVPPDDFRIIALEDQILRIFVDLCALFRRLRSDGDSEEFGKHTSEEYLFTFLRDMVVRRDEELPASFLVKLRRAGSHYGLDGIQRSPELQESLFRICKGNRRIDEQIGPILSLLQSRLDNVGLLRDHADDGFRELLSRLITETQGRYPAIHDIARELQYHYFERPVQERATKEAFEDIENVLSTLASDPHGPGRGSHISKLVAVPLALKGFLSRRLEQASHDERQIILEILARRYYKMCDLRDFRVFSDDGLDLSSSWYEYEGKKIHFFATHVVSDDLRRAVEVLRRYVAQVPPDDDVVVDFYLFSRGRLRGADATSEDLRAVLDELDPGRPIRRVIVAITGSETGLGSGEFQGFTFRMGADGFLEELVYRGMHPMLSKRLFLWRLRDLDTVRVPSPEDVYLYRVTGKDERLICLGEVRDLTPVRDGLGRVVGLPSFERTLSKCLVTIRREQSKRTSHDRYQWNRVHLFLWPPLDLSQEEINGIIHRLAPETVGLGLERIVVQADILDRATGAFEPKLLEVATRGRQGLRVRLRDVPTHPMRPRSAYEQTVVRLRQRGLMHPYEIISMLTPGDEGDVQSDFPRGRFQEHDFDDAGALVPVDRPPGNNTSNIIVGLLSSFTEKYPEGMTRVALFGDPSRGMGSLAEPECRRIIAALDLAREKRLPVEWYAVSAGAKISMESGTENMDWIADVLRRVIEFTQQGGEVNVLVCGINVGAQPYWNAEATMLMHTKGILVMVPGSAMVLTGKQALDYSGGVSAEDNTGIGGYDRIMGPNGQAQYAARDIADACHILLRHYEHTYVLPGERFPRRAATNDPIDRDVRHSPHGHVGVASFATVGEVFDPRTNPGRKRPFDIRKVMRAATDQDHDVLERWYGMRDAETAVVWDAHIGGYPVCLIGIESKPLARIGFVPADGPTTWTAGTLFPMSSKKVARAINAASNNRPLVVLANLSGFDGSPDSMRSLQLEYGAEIGRAVVNFRGPIVFLVVSRYHGGAFVVFSNKLNPSLEVAALEGTYASVIGGAPAAAVVFAGEVHKRTLSDDRVIALQQEIEHATGNQRVALGERLSKVKKVVHSEKLREVAEEFDGVHSVHRALEMGSVHRIIPAVGLRPYLVEAIERGMQRELHPR